MENFECSKRTQRKFSIGRSGECQVDPGIWVSCCMILSWQESGGCAGAHHFDSRQFGSVWQSGSLWYLWCLKPVCSSSEISTIKISKLCWKPEIADVYHELSMNHCFNQCCPGSWSAWPKASRLHTLAAWQQSTTGAAPSSASRWMIWRDMTWLYEMWLYTFIHYMNLYDVWYTISTSNECDWTW